MPSSNGFEINDIGEATWLSENAAPTQSQLRAFLTEYRHKITNLCILLDDGRNESSLNFDTIGTLPHLKSLFLSGISVDALCFTTSNTPVLESLEISSLSCDHTDGLRFELALPLLRTFKAELVIIEGKCDFGLSLSRCPKLEIVRTYKFRYLTGDNFMILPNCRELTLCHSESTDCLEVISAPKLTKLSIQSAYDLAHVRLWDLPIKVSIHDVEKLIRDLADACKDIGVELKQWADKWKDGTFTGKDTFRMRWIGFHEIKGFDFNKNSDYHEELLYESLERTYNERREMAKGRIWANFESEMSKKPVVIRKEDLPMCKVNSGGVNLSVGSRKHLTANKRLRIVGMTKFSPSDLASDVGLVSGCDSDSDMDDMFW